MHSIREWKSENQTGNRIRRIKKNDVRESALMKKKNGQNLDIHKPNHFNNSSREDSEKRNTR